MAFRINATVAARVQANLEAGKTSTMVAHEIVQMTQNDLVKVRIPGGIAATFKREDDAGKTFGALYGEFTAENILSTQAERIQEGEYVGRLKASEDVRASFGGQQSLGGMAVEAVLMACLESEDEVAREWAAKAVEGAAAPEQPAEPQPAKKSRSKKSMADVVGKV